MQLIRAYSQTLPDGRIRETSLYRSDCYLYIASLTADPKREDGLWTGELGICSKPELVTLYKALQQEIADGKTRLFTLEVPITFAAHVERDGRGGMMHKEPWADYTTATVALAGRHKIEFILQDLEGALAWAV